MLPAIGSLSALNSGGRLGVTVDARPLAPPQDGRQLVALQLQTVDRRDAQGQAASRVSGLAPLPAEASERPGASRRVLAAREERAGAATARLQDQLSPAQDDAAARLRLRRYADAGQEPPQTQRIDLTSWAGASTLVGSLPVPGSLLALALPVLVVELCPARFMTIEKKVTE